MVSRALSQPEAPAIPDAGSDDLTRTEEEKANNDHWYHYWLPRKPRDAFDKMVKLTEISSRVYRNRKEDLVKKIRSLEASTKAGDIRLKKSCESKVELLDNFNTLYWSTYRTVKKLDITLAQKWNEAGDDDNGTPALRATYTQMAEVLKVFEDRWDAVAKLRPDRCSIAILKFQAYSNWVWEHPAEAVGGLCILGILGGGAAWAHKMHVGAKGICFVQRVLQGLGIKAANAGECGCAALAVGKSVAICAGGTMLVVGLILFGVWAYNSRYAKVSKEVAAKFRESERKYLEECLKKLEENEDLEQELERQMAQLKGELVGAFSAVTEPDAARCLLCLKHEEEGEVYKPMGCRGNHWMHEGCIKEYAWRHQDRCCLCEPAPSSR